MKSFNYRIVTGVSFTNFDFYSSFVPKVLAKCGGYEQYSKELLC